MCNLKAVACSDKLTGNYQLCLLPAQFPSAIRSVSVPFTSLFQFYDPVFQGLSCHSPSLTFSSVLRHLGNNL